MALDGGESRQGLGMGVGRGEEGMSDAGLLVSMAWQVEAMSQYYQKHYTCAFHHHLLLVHFSVNEILRYIQTSIK